MARTKKKGRRRPAVQGRRKISELVWEFAGDFIRMGDTPDERQSLLNAACSAWNMACNPPEVRQRNLDSYMKEYLRHNLGADKEEVDGVRDNIEKLIAQKLKLFPNDLRQIVGAQMVKTDGKDRIEVVSARFD
jgi:hypothetical protein